MNGKQYFENMKKRQNLLRKQLRIKFVEQCKIYKEKKSFTHSGFILYLGIEAIGKDFLYITQILFFFYILHYDSNEIRTHNDLFIFGLEFI